jgi:autotransporter-associated beta strand protein
MKLQLTTPGLIRHARCLFFAALGLTLCAAAKAQTAYQSAVLGDNPLAFYALNPGADGTTNAPDLSGNGNNGVPANISPAIGPTEFITNAASFDGTAAIDLSQGTNEALLDFTGPITLEAWVQPSSASEYADILAKGYDSTTGQEDALGVNGPYGELSGGPQTTAWSYVVFSSDGTNASLYQNGALVVQQADVSGSVALNGDDWVIGNGSSSGGSRFFSGNISEAAIYNYGLSAAQVQSHYYAGIAGTTNLNDAAPVITNQPQPQAVYPGGTATFSVGVLSALPTTNQWFSNSVAIIGQTNASLTLKNVETNYAAEYSVVVGNNNGTTTSGSALLTVLPPGVLQWSANGNTGVWDTDTSANWIDLANSQQTVFTSGEQVLFDDSVGAPTSVTVSGTVSPGLITVDSSTNAFTIGSGTIDGAGSLIKEGSSTLTINSAGSLTGSVTVSGGAVVAGNNSLGTVSSITISNGATFDFGGSAFGGNKPILVSGTGLNGEGALFNSAGSYPQEALNVTLAGDTMFGYTARWDLTDGSQISGPHNLTLDFSGGIPSGYGGYAQWNGVTLGSNLSGIFLTNGSTLGIQRMSASCQNPAMLITVGPTCQIAGYGGFNGSFSVESGGEVVGETGYGPFSFSGSVIHVFGGGELLLADAGDSIDCSSFILDGNSTFASYSNPGSDTVSSAVTLNGVVHFILGNHDMLYSNVISGSGGFVVDYYGNNVVLSASNTYSGPTVIGSVGNNPVVALTGNGSISDSALIFFGGTNADVAHIDVSGRSDQTLTLASGQTLAGIGTINGNLVVSPGATISPAGTNTSIGITTGTNAVGTLFALGGITLSGTTLIKLDGSGTNDEVGALDQITYGGTLSLVNISGAPLVAGNSFQIFDASTDSGSFATITPATPGTGLAWDTSQLSSGIIGVVSAPPSQLQFTNSSISDGNLVFGGSGGKPNGTYTLLTTTNLSSPWVPIATNSFDGNGNFSVTNSIAGPQQYFSIEQ